MHALFIKFVVNMKILLVNNFVELVPNNELSIPNDRIWYLAHHGVRHKQKDKLRLVFDCSLQFENVCLNDLLMQGPDLTNNMLGVLLRFRQCKKFALLVIFKKCSIW